MKTDGDDLSTVAKREGLWTHRGTDAATLQTVLGDVVKGDFRTTWAMIKCLGPYALVMFAIIPGAAYLLFGATAGKTALVSTLLAELFTNIHSFCIIAPNHAGSDIYRFETETKAKSDEFFLRACIGSTNYHTGSDFGLPGSFAADIVDFPQGWLNYQIEHHMFPDLSMLSYQKAAPEVKRICEKYKVPYVQEPVWTRVKKTADIMTGESTMLVWENGD